MKVQWKPSELKRTIILLKYHRDHSHLAMLYANGEAGNTCSELQTKNDCPAANVLHQIAIPIRRCSVPPTQKGRFKKFICKPIEMALVIHNAISIWMECNKYIYKKAVVVFQTVKRAFIKSHTHKKSIKPNMPAAPPLARRKYNHTRISKRTKKYWVCWRIQLAAFTYSTINQRTLYRLRDATFDFDSNFFASRAFDSDCKITSQPTLVLVNLFQPWIYGLGNLHNS